MTATTAEPLIASANTYRWMTKPPVIGTLRAHSWRYLMPPISDDDPAWIERCKAYWALQEQTYGLRFSNFTMRVGWEEMLVYTHAAILDIMPGRRVADYVVPWKAAKAN